MTDADVDPFDWSPLDALLQEAIDGGMLPGAILKVVHRGRIVHSSALGSRHLGGDQPMADDTIFRLYSLTKPVTAAAMMALWDDGAWRPDDPLGKFIPELAHLPVLGAAPGDPSSPPITLEHVMTHTAGFGYGFKDEPIDALYREAGVPPIPYAISQSDYVGKLAQVPLAYAPGTGWQYSVAMDVQAVIIERITGMSFRDFVLARITAPLKMTDTDFFLPAGKQARLAPLYAAVARTAFEMPEGPLAPSLSEKPLLASGGAGLVSIADDFVRFARMIHQAGEFEGIRILSEAAVATMRSSHTPPTLLRGGFGISPHFLRAGYEFAYNGIVVTDPHVAQVSLGRGTYLWDGAAGSWFWSDPEHDVVLVCVLHLLADANLLGLQFKSRDIVRDVLGRKRSSSGS